MNTTRADTCGRCRSVGPKCGTFRSSLSPPTTLTGCAEGVASTEMVYEKKDVPSRAGISVTKLLQRVAVSTAALGARRVLVRHGTARQHPVRHRVDPLETGWRTRTKRHVPALRNTVWY